MTNEDTARLEALVRAGADLATLCQAADRVAQAAIGHGLFTVMRFHPESVEVERLYSSRPDVYPPGGRKAKRDTAWGRLVLGEGRAFHGSGPEDIRWAFADHATILGLGLETVINAPARGPMRGPMRGPVRGTVNLLAGPGGLTAADIPAALAIAELLGEAL